MKHKLLFAAILVMTVFAGQNVKAQNTVFGYTYLGTTPPSLGAGVFPSYDVVLVVPCSSAVAYNQHPEWGLFSNIVEDCGSGISNPEISPIRIYAENGCIVVDGAEDEKVHVFDLMGRSVRNESLSADVYLAKVVTRPAQKVVVM